MIDPERVVLDGALGAAAPYVVNGAQEILDVYSPMVVEEGMDVVPGALGKNAELYGSIALFRQTYVDALCASDQ
jgi:hypothetical protein